MRVVLLCAYDLGRPPLGLASPAAWLRRAGFDVSIADVSREPMTPARVADAGLVAVYLPMHTATRLALPVLDEVRRHAPSAVLCAYGLYAPLNDTLLAAHGVSLVIGPEPEQALVDAAREIAAGRAPRAGNALAIPRLTRIAPDRAGLPPLDHYASLVMPDGSRRLAGATEASRGCKHFCRHCPIVPVYNGQFRITAVDVVVDDIRAQVSAGAEHVTFNDPDFFNGPTHARRMVEALHAEWPALTYDVTIKVEHLLRHRDLLPVLRDTGCLFVTSAVESVDDAVLARLEKGHTRADVFEAVRLCRETGLTLSPTFVAFTPWTTMATYRDLLDTIEALGIVEHVSPVQLGIRLLITHGSRLLELPDIAARIAPFDPDTLTFPWQHDDPRVDALQRQVMRLASTAHGRSRTSIWSDVRALAAEAEGVALAPFDAAAEGTPVPYINEPWYCCAEPVI
jgi:radical SAM superfamily enzyme YgiQ (UPF0313 family)